MKAVEVVHRVVKFVIKVVEFVYTVYLQCIRGAHIGTQIIGYSASIRDVPRKSPFLNVSNTIFKEA